MRFAGMKVMEGSASHQSLPKQDDHAGNDAGEGCEGCQGKPVCIFPEVGVTWAADILPSYMIAHGMSHVY